MADAATFTLQLVDRVTGPGRRAASSIDSIKRKLRETKDLTNLTGKEFAKLQGARFAQKVGEGVDWLTGKLWTAVKYGGLLTAALGAAAGGWVTKGVVSMGMFADASRRAFAYLTGGVAEGDAAFNRITALANKLGLDVEDTTNQFKHLLAMQFKVGEAEELVKISADLQAIMGDAHATERALRAITQIKAKGRVQSEELVGQLAEAGVSTVLVYEELGKMLGKTRDEVRKLITAGKVDADTGITAVKRAIMRKVHESTPGEAALGFSESTLTGMMTRLQNMPKKIFLAVSQSMGADFDELKGTLRSIIGDLDSIDTNKIATFVRGVLELVKNMVPLVKEFAAGFGEGFDAMMEGVRASGSVTDNLATARDVGKALAQFFGLTLKLVGLIGQGLAFLSTPTGKVVAGVALFTMGLIEILMIVGSVVTSLSAIGVTTASLATGWATVAGAVGSAVGGIVSAVTWLGTAAATVGSIIAAIVTAPAFLAAAIIAVATGAIAAIIIWREEIAKFMLACVDAVSKAWNDINLAMYNALVAMFDGLWAMLKRFVMNAVTLLKNLFTGNWGAISKADFGIGSTKSALAAAGIAGPSQPAALTAGQAGAPAPRTPELSPALQSVVSKKGDTRIENNMTIQVSGEDAQSGRELGRQVGEGATEKMESFFSDFALQSGA